MKRQSLRAPWGRILACASLMALLPLASHAAPHTARPDGLSAQSGTCEVSYTVSEWAGGFTANVQVTNNGPSLGSWELAWTFGGNQQISNYWNSKITQSGSRVSAKNEDYNGSLPTGGSQSFGFQASFSGINSTPADFTLNGVTCNGGTLPTATSALSTPTPTVGSLPPTATLPSTPGVLQAEAAALGGGAVAESINAGYNGTGYVNAPVTGGSITFQNVDGGAGGNVTLRFRYALGAAARTGQLHVNGTSTAITFEPTAGWTTWATNEVIARLSAGTANTIVLESTGQDLANIDELTVVAGGITPTPVTPTPAVPTPTQPAGSGRQMEDLNRGLVSIRQGSNTYVTWRMLGTDPANVAFNLYRGSTRLNSTPITGGTNYTDAGAPAGSSYTVRAVVNGQEGAASEPSLNLSTNYLDVPLQVPPAGSGYTYSANDASVGDADGDGQLEIFLKWDPSNAKDNSQDGYTGNVYIDAYRLNGARLWRIDLGRNIRAGAHYTQFQVYDYDGDGRAELAVKTADGTRSGTGQVIGSASADHRNSAGHIITGPEYLTVFSGLTGAALATAPFQPARGDACSWGDCRGNRSERYLAGTAYLDGQRPSIIMARGYYARSAIAAWDYRNGQLTRRWTFDSVSAGSSWGGRGTHSLSVADVDRDGRDEIIYGGMTINANGTGRYTTSYYAHGDALHVSDFVTTRPGQEIWQIHEQSSGNAASLRDANTGAQIMAKTNTSGEEGPARGVAGDIYAGNPGAEFWGFGTGLGNLYNAAGGSVGRNPSSANFLIWWDGDPVRELLDRTQIDKYGTGGDTRLLTGSGVASNNGTKSTPALSGDLLGDWREEVIWRTSDSQALRIYMTTAPTTRRLYTLLHDAQYRVALAWQNTAYNQPPHPHYVPTTPIGIAP